MLNIFFIVILGASFHANAVDRNFGSECYEAEMGENGRPAPRSIVVTIPDDEKLIVSGQFLWNGLDYALVHNRCRNEHNCMFAADTTYRRDNDREGGWNEHLIGSITCSNVLRSGGYAYRTTYSNMVSDGEIASFLTPQQQQNANNRVQQPASEAATAAEAGSLDN